jgi:hypothetical protein
MTTPASLCEGPIFYFYAFTFMYLFFMQESIVFSSTSFFLFFLFCKHHVVVKDLGTYTQLDMSDHELLLLTSPLRWISWEAKSQAPIFLCVWLKLLLHIYVVSVSNHRRLNDGWVCGLAKKLLHETLPEKNDELQLHCWLE